MQAGSGELHRIVQPDTVRKLAEEFGAGTAMFIPATTANADHIARLVGLAETSALVEAFGGGTVYIPALERRPRGRELPPTLSEVARLTKRGWSARKIAEKHGCTRRTVYGKRARIKQQAE
jgi:DNA-binding NarL/FixJ family response regulator